MASPIITLTTDLGYKDFYVPAAKGVIWKEMPGANIVDITHQIKPFRLDEASFILRGCFEDFPQGTVHIISIDASRGSNTGFIAAKAKGHFFLCHNNGIISLVVDEEDIEVVVELPASTEDLIFPLKKIFAPVSVKIAETGDISKLGKAMPHYERKANMRPLIEESIIRGTVIYIDNTGNAIVNIDKASFNRVSRGRKFRISYNRNEFFEKIHTHYNEVQDGERICLFGTNGLLEIAINKGSCTSLLGIKTGQLIMVEFE